MTRTDSIRFSWGIVSTSHPCWNFKSQEYTYGTFLNLNTRRTITKICFALPRLINSATFTLMFLNMLFHGRNTSRSNGSSCRAFTCICLNILFLRILWIVTTALTYLEGHVDPCADFGEAILSRTMALDSVSMVRPITSRTSAKKMLKRNTSVLTFAAMVQVKERNLTSVSTSAAMVQRLQQRLMKLSSLTMT